MTDFEKRAVQNRMTEDRIIANGLREEIRQYIREVDRLRAELDTLKSGVSKLSQELEKG